MKVIILLFSLLAISMILSACGGDIPKDLQAELTEENGCVDMAAYARNDDDSIALLVRGTDLVEKATEDDQDTEFTFDLSLSTVHPRSHPGTTSNLRG